MKKLLLLITMTVACLSTAQAAISVGASGSAIQTFPSQPLVSDGWSTLLNGGNGALIADAPTLFSHVNTNVASSMLTRVGSTTTTPNITSATLPRHNGTLFVLQSVPTTAAYLTLLASIQNDTGLPQNSLTVSFDRSEQHAAGSTVVEEVPGLRVYYSLSGAAGSWTEVPELSGDSVGSVSFTISLSSAWNAGSTMYVMWADDNAGADRNDAGNEEGGYILDNVFFAGGVVTPPLTVSLTSPTNGVHVAPSTVNVTASTAGGNAPVTSVSFYTNNVLFFTDNAAPYSNQLANLPAGTYTVYARAVNGVDPDAFSATNIVVVRSEFVPYVSGTITENFDIMGATGILTPQGWWVGAPPAGADQFVTVGNGSAAPSTTIHGFNYGLTSDGNRSLGTAPTGADRNTVARIQNQGLSNIVSFTFSYDAEVWRTHATAGAQETLTNYVSFDLGATWIPTGADFITPPDVTNNNAVATAIDGHQPGHRTAGIATSTITPPAPIPPGGVIYVRWQNLNEGGTDGGLAIDNFSFTATAFSQSTLFVFISSPAFGQNIGASCAGTASVTVNASASFSVTNVRFSLDGGSFINDDLTPYSANYPTVAIGGHTLTALAFDGSGSTVSTSINFTVSANAAPVINYSNVYSGSVTGLTFQIGTPITNQFGITDDGTLATVEFIVNGNIHYATNVSFGQIVVNNLLAGNNTFTVRVTDNCGNIGTASHVVVGTLPAAPLSVIVSNGAVWKYNNAGAQPANDIGGNIWYQSAFDDSAWLSGLTEIGGGDAVAPPNTNPERTLINIGTPTRFSTIYFRKQFTVIDPSAFSGLSVRSLADDGSAVYLNGNLVATFNTTNETGIPFAYTDLAANAPSEDGTQYASSNIVNSLVAGVNTLAVEVHQNDTGSSDLSFDLMLWGLAPSGPTLTVRYLSSTQVELSWPVSADTAGALLYFKSDLNAGSWSLENTIPTSDSISGGIHYRTYTVPTPNRFWTLRTP